jgi:hypothetical protein
MRPARSINIGMALFISKYRTNMETCQFNDSIWAFGCSNVYGQRLEPDQTMPALLEKITGISTINFGVRGGNAFNIKQNLEHLLPLYSPYAIIIAWPAPTRWTDEYGVNWGTWHLEQYRDPATHLREKNWLVSFVKYKKIVATDEIVTLTKLATKEIRKLVSHIPVIEYFYTCDTETPVHHSANISDSILRVDLATDNSHPGPITQKNAANWVAAQLKEKGVIPWDQ